MLFKNPVIPGYNPDPSICRVGDDFYLVNSTFEFFPGVPIYHSRNLVNWELTGYCLNRRSQLELEGCRNSGGIYAPTIRYHKGMFYMITTNVTDKGNFVVHTDDINKDWSDPAWIDQGGIDPSLFWDDDDCCYYCSTGNLNGVRGIVAFKINPMTGEILSDKHLISTGCGGQCAEGPHIYKKDGWYYLMIAEGGTEYAHRETIQRSKNVFGPYTPCPHNPIISHKEYKKSEIQATGHADLVEDANGNWWLVFLGIRRFSHALLHNLGRETFLAPVTWSEDGWPVVGYNGNGTIELVMDAPLPGINEPETIANTIGINLDDAIYLGNSKVGYALCHKEGMVNPVIVKIDEVESNNILDVNLYNKNINKKLADISRSIIENQMKNDIEVWAVKTLVSMMYKPDNKKIFDGLEYAYNDISHKLILKSITVIPGIDKKECILNCISENIITLLISGVFSNHKLLDDELINLIKNTVSVPTEDRLKRIHIEFEKFYAKNPENKVIEIIAGLISLEYSQKQEIEELIKDFSLSNDLQLGKDVKIYLNKKVN